LPLLFSLLLLAHPVATKLAKSTLPLQHHNVVLANAAQQTAIWLHVPLKQLLASNWAQTNAHSLLQKQTLNQLLQAMPQVAAQAKQTLNQLLQATQVAAQAKNKHTFIQNPASVIHIGRVFSCQPLVILRGYLCAGAFLKIAFGHHLAFFLRL